MTFIINSKPTIKGVVSDGESHSASETPGSPGIINNIRKQCGHTWYILSSNSVNLIAFTLFLLLVLVAILGPLIVPYNPLATSAVDALKSPSWSHWFGTDQLGRDVFSRVIIATRLDLLISVTAVAKDQFGIFVRFSYQCKCFAH